MIEDILDSGRTALEWFGGLALFFGRAVRESVRRPFEFAEILRQVFEIGARSAPLILLSGVAVGVVLSMHTRVTLERFGAAAMVPTALAFALVKETGPLITGLLISGRVGAGIGAELGGMRVTEQIDALESLAVDSFKYLVFTRVLACAVALPLLTVLMNFAGMFGGFLAESARSGTSFRLYFAHAFGSLGFYDFIPPTLKTIAFGLIIGSTSAYLGYHAKGGAEGVGRASTQSVVLSSVFLIVVNYRFISQSSVRSNCDGGETGRGRFARRDRRDWQEAARIAWNFRDDTRPMSNGPENAPNNSVRLDQETRFDPLEPRCLKSCLRKTEHKKFADKSDREPHILTR